MALSDHPIKKPTVRVRTVTNDALTVAYESLFPEESRQYDISAITLSWLLKYEVNPAECISTVGEQRPFTQALFSALHLPLPNTTEMAMFLATNPEMENQATEIVYVSAKTPDGDNVDLIVRAISCEHAEIAWRNHFDGWDLPEHPFSIMRIPIQGTPGAIGWDIIVPAAEENLVSECDAEATSVLY